MEKTKKTIIKDYSEYLPQYYGISIPGLLKKYLNSVSFKSLLDLGSGDGALLYALKKNDYFKNRSIFAIDLSPISIGLVHKIDKKITAYVDDAQTISKIKTNSIDFLVSTHVVEHVNDKKMLRAVERVTKKNATIYIGTVFKKWYGWYYYRRNGKWVMDLTHLREYNKDDQLMKLIDKKKFKILESKKTQLWFPAIDFLLRRLFVRNRKLFADQPIFSAIRKLKVPIPGYYNWEIVLKKC
jgi:2-polyprenyl-3-methyl-5-hydroxy-6-metoxy-1,4-benzoquinol methylase